MEIARMWTLNTAHISRETANWLDSKECNLGVIKYESGWIIDIPGWITFDKNDILKVPEDLFALISDARDIRVAKLQLDSDGLIDKSYKIYDWKMREYQLSVFFTPWMEIYIFGTTLISQKKMRIRYGKFFLSMTLLV